MSLSPRLDRIEYEQKIEALMNMEFWGGMNAFGTCVVVYVGTVVALLAAYKLFNRKRKIKKLEKFLACFFSLFLAPFLYFHPFWILFLQCINF